MSSPPGWTAPLSNEPSKTSFLDFFLVTCGVTTMALQIQLEQDGRRKGKDGKKVVHKIVNKIFRTLDYYLSKISSH